MFLKWRLQLGPFPARDLFCFWHIHLAVGIWGLEFLLLMWTSFCVQIMNTNSCDKVNPNPQGVHSFSQQNFSIAPTKTQTSCWDTSKKSQVKGITQRNKVISENGLYHEDNKIRWERERMGPSQKETAPLRKRQLDRDMSDKKKPSIKYLVEEHVQRSSGRT